MGHETGTDTELKKKLVKKHLINKQARFDFMKSVSSCYKISKWLTDCF